jgi:hypothetical protein
MFENISRPQHGVRCYRTCHLICTPIRTGARAIDVDKIVSERRNEGKVILESFSALGAGIVAAERMHGLHQTFSPSGSRDTRRVGNGQ